jgi:hypothetical protein
MKFIAIAAAIATAQGAAVATDADCGTTAGTTCSAATDCCGKVTSMTQAGTDKSFTVLDAKSKVCAAKTLKVYTKTVAANAAVTNLNLANDAAGTYKGTFTCDATGAASLSAAVAVLAASFYMA